MKELLELLLIETSKTRRDAVLFYAVDFVRQQLRLSSGHATIAEQEAALAHPLAKLLRYPKRPGDLRRGRGIGGSLSLLPGYIQVHAEVKGLLKGRGEGGGNRSRSRFEAPNSNRLKAEFPELRTRPALARQAATAPPKKAALIVLQARYGLSPDRLEAILKQERAAIRRLRTSK